MSDERLRHLLGIEGLQKSTAEHILNTARAFLDITRRPVRKVPTLRGKTIINLFYEASTRTR
ncbi:MAG TPA: aspartate carbamoyltransferase, partial [Polyangiaceae bacterium]|nr:aspartate carbamoyltransferase [Polyangiaceae bacterium]